MIIERTVPSLGEESRDIRSSIIPLAHRPAVDFIDRTRLLARNAPIVQQSTYIQRPLTVLAITYRPLLLAALVISALVLCREIYRRSLGLFAALILFAYSYNFASCLEVAIVQSLEVRRFVTVQVFFTILAQFLALWFILEFVLENVRPRKNVASLYRLSLKARRAL